MTAGEFSGLLLISNAGESTMLLFLLFAHPTTEIVERFAEHALVRGRLSDEVLQGVREVVLGGLSTVS
jgi:hypothetical protein